MCPLFSKFQNPKDTESYQVPAPISQHYKASATPLVACLTVVNSLLLVSRPLILFKYPAFSVRPSALGTKDSNPSHTSPTVYYHVCMWCLILKQPTCWQPQGEPIMTLMMVLSVNIPSEKQNWHEWYGIRNLSWGVNWPQLQEKLGEINIQKGMLKES